MKTIIHRLFLTNYLYENLKSDTASTPVQILKQTLFNGGVVKAVKYSTLLLGSVIALISALLISSCSSSTEEKIPALSKEALIARGKYLTTTSACHDCHSPKIMTAEGPIVDTTRILSGHPANDPIPPVIITNDWILFGNDLTYGAGPWGLSFAANLTPHDTGTGSWSFEQFKTAIRKGKYKGLEGSRSLLPPMPWDMYQHFTDEDLLAIFTFLQSIKPIDNLVPPPVSPGDLSALNSK